MAVQLQVLFIIGMAFSVMPSLALPPIPSNIVDQGTGCPDIPAISDFNPDRYAGKWFEVQKFDNTMQRNAKCVSFTHVVTEDGVFNTEYQRIITLFGRTLNITTEGTFVRIDPDRPTLFSVAIKGLKMGNYYIGSTDYDNYSIAYACSKIFNLPRIEMAWFLSREKQNLLSSDEMSNLYANMTALGIDTSKFTQSSQTDCEADFSI